MNYNFDLDSIFYDQNHEVSRVSVGERMPAVVCVDGACRGNGQAGARASFGVYFGVGSPYNWHGLLPDTERKTSNAAEIFAAQKATEIIAEYSVWDKELFKDGIVVITDSTYLFGAITTWIHTWKSNDFRSTNGTPVTNGDAILNLYNSIRRLQAQGIVFQFCRQDRANNRDADSLANYALDSQERCNYLLLGPRPRRRLRRMVPRYFDVGYLTVETTEPSGFGCLHDGDLWRSHSSLRRAGSFVAIS